MVRRHTSRTWVRAAFVVAALAGALGACSGAGPDEPIGTTTSAITFPNDQPAFDYFVAKGLTPFQAAGIVGNLDQESGVDPTAVQSGGPGRGIAQWSVGGRWDTDTNDNATWYAGMQGQSVLALQLQLDFVWYELVTFSSYGLTSLEATTNVSEATIAFETDFEGCGTCDQSTRITYAENVLAAFGTGDGGAAPDAEGPSSDADGSGSACTVTTTGESGECLDTTACAALGDHVSTAGYCPGPDNIQCCTATPESAGTPDAATQTHADATMTPHPDAGAHGDGGNHTSPTPSDASRSGAVVDGAPSDPIDASGVHTDEPPSRSTAGGCAATPRGATGGGASACALWLAGIAAVGARKRKRATATLV